MSWRQKELLTGNVDVPVLAVGRTGWFHWGHYWEGVLDKVLKYQVMMAGDDEQGDQQAAM